MIPCPVINHFNTFFVMYFVFALLLFQYLDTLGIIYHSHSFGVVTTLSIICAVLVATCTVPCIQ